MFNTLVLNEKVKFPLLEFCSSKVAQEIEYKDQIKFCDQIETYKTMGGNVVLGMLLQLRLKTSYEQSLEKATEYIAQADIWYICDIIGERVFGYALLAYPEKTLKYLTHLINHPSEWVVRAIGAGGHFAVKRGLERGYAERLFPFLLQKSSAKGKEIRQGIGWAAKTTAKFHPEVIAMFQDQINNETATANWFRRKVRIGLERHAYAKRNTG